MQTKYYFDLWVGEPYRVRRDDDVNWFDYLNDLFDTPSEMLEYYQDLEEYEICQKIIENMNITTGEKVTLLSERLKILATLEYDTLMGLNKQIAGSKERYIEKYMNRFIGKVMNNPEIVELLDQNVKKDN